MNGDVKQENSAATAKNQTGAVSAIKCLYRLLARKILDYPAKPYA